MIISCNIYKAVSLRIDCFFHTQKGVIDLCVRFGTKDTVSEPATSTLFITIACGDGSYPIPKKIRQELRLC